MMKTNNISIAIDLDGVLFDFEGEFCERFGYDNRHLSCLTDRYPEVDKEVIEEFVHNPETYKDLVPIFGGVLLVNHAKRLGFHVVLLTSRPKGTKEVTEQMLEHFNVQYDDLVFAYDKAETISDYNRIYNHRPIKLLVDDIVSNLSNLPPETMGLAWEQPWNVGYYPRARYNPDNMKLEILDTVSSEWREMWRNKNE